MLGGADAQEQKRLRDGMEQDEEARGPYRLGGCPHRRKRDEAEVGDGGIASTRLALDCEMAMNEHSAKVMPPTSMTMTAGAGDTWNTGASFTSRKTPAFTMVEECNSAEVGVGATMRPEARSGTASAPPW